MSENDVIRLPEVIIFAGPNGSGKSTITRMAEIGGEYINADDIKRATLCTDLEAAIKAEELRECMIVDRKDFTFETVLSTDRNLLLLQRAKEKGYFIRGIDHGIEDRCAEKHDESGGEHRDRRQKQ